MSDLNADRTEGVLRPGWSAALGDYAIAGGWILRGEALVVCDAAGGVYAFDGKSGASTWARQGAHNGAVVVWSLQSDGGGSPVGAALLEDVVAELYWRPDGRALAALDARGGVTVWRIGSGHHRR